MVVRFLTVSEASKLITVTALEARFVAIGVWVADDGDTIWIWCRESTEIVKTHRDGSADLIVGGETVRARPDSETKSDGTAFRPVRMEMR